MLDKKTLMFLKHLNLNNSKEWLVENKDLYEFVKNDIFSFSQLLISSLENSDEQISNAHLDYKKCITRLNRDLRFSKDKTPYKTDYYIVLNKNGKNSPSAFYYVHIEPGNCFAGGGVYNPQSPELKKIRHKIEHHFDEWMSIITNKEFIQIFPIGICNSGVLKNVPRGFNRDSPAMEFLKMKGFYTMKNMTDKEIVSEDVVEKIMNCFRATKPLIHFLNQAIEVKSLENR
jgi:uncharacterized protein (TIGR02453 family)